MNEDQRRLQRQLARMEAVVKDLEERVRDLERSRGSAQFPRTVTPEPPAISSTPSRSLRDVAVPPASWDWYSGLGLPRLSGELEVLIGTSWLNRLGVIAIIVGAAYFLKYSFDNQWIGPAGRVALTVILALALLITGEWYQQRRLAVFAQGLSGGGAAILFFAVYAASVIYRLIGFAPAFGLMVLTTVITVALALRYDSMAIASLGILGGFLTPLLLGSESVATGVSSPMTPALYLYFLLMAGGSYLLTIRKRWWKFGGLALTAAFLMPVTVGKAGTPDPSAATLYFLLITLGTLLLSLSLGVVRLAWMALAGGLISRWSIGAGAIDSLFALAYFGIVTVASVIVAYRRNWENLALAAIVAGPLIFITRQIDFEIAGFLYLAAIAGTALFASVRRSWKWTDLVLVLSTGLAATSEINFLTAAVQVREIIGVTILFVLFSVTLSLNSVEHTERRLLSVILAAAIFSGQLYLLLGGASARADSHAFAALALAAYHVILARILTGRGVSQLTLLVLLGLGLTFLTIAIPLKLHQETIPLAWAIEGAALAWAASRTRNLWAGRAAAVIGLITAMRLFVVETQAIASGDIILIDPRVAFAVGIGALGLEALLLRQLIWTREEDRYIVPGLGALGVGLVLWWGGWEISGFFNRMAPIFAQAHEAKQAALSAWFTLYGFGLVVAGIWKDQSVVRWSGIAVLAVTIFKVFVIDLAAVAVVFRILSLLVLGALLLLASLVYSRYRGRVSKISMGESP